jgi:hypothetical protein
MDESDEIRGQQHFMPARHSGSVPEAGQLSTAFIATIRRDIKRMNKAGRRRMIPPLPAGTLPCPPIGRSHKLAAAQRKLFEV